MPRRLTEEERLGIITRVVGLLTACRNGMDDDALATYIAEILTELNDDDAHVTLGRLAWFLVMTSGLASHACKEWNEAAEGKPADAWLAAVGTQAAARLGRAA